MTEREALIMLNLVTGMGSITAARIKKRLGSYAAAMDASESDLKSVQGIGFERAPKFYESFHSVQWEKEIAHAERLKVQLVTLVDPDYPQALKEIADPPLVLYIRGSVAAFQKPGIAMVGTRHATIYGRETARRFAYQLAGAGYSIISGLATGIDSEAHWGAVQSSGATIGVLGGALDCFFPKENEKLAREIVLKGGAVISEYPFGRMPDRQTFPMRNRIVSGLSKGVLVIESPLASGTMITVNQALEQNRTVMAVPGRIDSPASQGSNRLLRNGARLVTSADEVIEELQDLFCNQRELMRKRKERAEETPAIKKAEGRPKPALSDDERKLYALLTEEGDSVDALVRASGLPTGQASSILIGLQVKRLAKALPGGRVARIS